MQTVSPASRLFKLEKSPRYYTVALTYRPPSAAGQVIYQGPVVYMDVIEASCIYQAVFLALYHHFCNYLATHWQNGREPLSTKQLAKLDAIANSFAYTAFLRIGTRRQQLYPSLGIWRADQGPSIHYEGVE